METFKLLKSERFNLTLTEWVMHSQGCLIGTNAMRVMHYKYGINSWSNLKTRYHGSPAYILAVRYSNWLVGAEFKKMVNHSGDAVGIWIGNNSFCPYKRLRSLLKAPSLGCDINDYPTGYLHSEHTIYYNE